MKLNNSNVRDKRDVHLKHILQFTFCNYEYLFFLLTEAESRLEQQS